jgi:hypothetical protein
MRRLILWLFPGFNPLRRMRRPVRAMQLYDPMQRYDTIRSQFEAESG